MVATGSDDNLWVATFSSIARITPSGAVSTFATVPRALNWGIAAGSDGNLWFTDRGSPSGIGRMTTSGTFTLFPVGGDPFGITSGADGNMWFTEFGGNRIGRSLRSSGPFVRLRAGPQLDVRRGSSMG